MVFIDLESYFSTKDKYDLRHMSMTEYCYDPRAKCHCMAWADTSTGEHGCEWDQKNITTLLKHWHTHEEVVIAFNGFFDFQFIIANNLGPLAPKKLFCAQLMALHILGSNREHKINLKTCSSLLNKRVTKHEGDGDSASFDGVVTIPGEQRPAVTKYAIDDVLSTAELIEHITAEKKLHNQHIFSINWALRQYLFPQLALDREELKNLIKQEHLEREQMLSRIGVSDGAVFRSVAQWSEMLAEHGVKLPTKKNPKGEDIPQGAKSDPFMREHKDKPGIIGDLVRARLLFSSNQVRTRAESYLKVAELDVGWPMHVWPSGAHTHRPVGRDGGGGNPLNLDKNKQGKKYGIRNAVIPRNEGESLVVFDYTGIELRVARWLCRDQTSIDAILNGKDLYRVFAAKAYGVDYDDVTDDQRFIGKQAELSCMEQNTGVLTQYGIKKITNVTLDDKLWDGVEWVSHGGVIYQGTKEVVSFDGLKITEDHEVFMRDGTTKQVRDIVDEKTLQSTPEGWNPIWGLDSNRKTSDAKRLPVCALRHDCRKEILPVYDILDAGPRNRFAVQCLSGNTIVHNCQYSLGHAKFRDRLKQEGVDYTEAEAKEQINNFRNVVHPKVRDGWRTLDLLLASYSTSSGKKFLSRLNMPDHEWHPATGITWPSGRLLSYYGRKQQQGKYGIETVHFPRSPWGDMSHPEKIYGGKMLENICQSITNEIVDERKRWIEQELGLSVALEVYDELIIPVPRKKIPALLPKLEELAVAPVLWWPDGPPLNIDLQVVDRYGDVEK